eukprot:357415-Chlamydomonas_euryale.AAC.7
MPDCAHVLEGAPEGPAPPARARSDAATRSGVQLRRGRARPRPMPAAGWRMRTTQLKLITCYRDPNGQRQRVVIVDRLRDPDHLAPWPACPPAHPRAPARRGLR